MLITLLVVLVIVGVLVYLLNTLVPIDARFKTVINVIIGLVLFLWCVDVLTGRNYVSGMFH